MGLFSFGKKRETVPFFMNSARLRTAESYFKENYKPYELLDAFDSDDEDTELGTKYSKNGYYGIPRFVPMQSKSKLDQMDKDELFLKESYRWMGFELIWLTLKKLVNSAHSSLFKPTITVNVNAEGNNPPEQSTSWMQNTPSQESSVISNTTGHTSVLIPNSDVEISWDKMGEVDLSENSEDNVSVYADDTGNIQQFQITTSDGRNATVFQFSVGMSKSVFLDIDANKMDLRSLVLSQNCATLIWVWDEKSSVVLITENSDPHCWSVQQWFRKILSDMALTDSIMIGHPYYWHPVVRKKLRRALKHFKRLYGILSKKESKSSKSSLPIAKRDRSNRSVNKLEKDNEKKQLELVCPRGITQVTINGGSSLNKADANGLEDDIVADLCGKWENFKELLCQTNEPTVDCVSKTFFSKGQNGSEFNDQVQSTTFLNFREDTGFINTEMTGVKVETKNELKPVESSDMHFKENNSEEDVSQSSSSITTFVRGFHSRPDDGKWNEDETYRNMTNGPFLKTNSSISDFSEKGASKRKLTQN